MLKFTKLFLSFVLSMMLLIANDDLSSNKKAIEASVKKHEKELIKISDAIWHNAELALEEYKSSKILSDYAEKNGFSIERGVAGMPTAFIATNG
ncbi:MAG: amidohydrolase, partial [Candidatus Marinimicrobia bacterium]|nr:amidohydrolase [Candidatus Neomarinimicrobiota bacterium]